MRLSRRSPPQRLWRYPALLAIRAALSDLQGTRAHTSQSWHEVQKWCTEAALPNNDLESKGLKSHEEKQRRRRNGGSSFRNLQSRDDGGASNDGHIRNSCGPPGCGGRRGKQQKHQVRQRFV